MSPRLAPALGLAAACTMLTGVGVLAISLGHDSTKPTAIAGAILVPAPPARVTPSPAARPVRTSRPKAVTQSPTVARPPSTSAGPIHSTSSAPPASGPSINPVATIPYSSPSIGSPATSASQGRTGTGPALHVTTGADYESYAQAVFQAINEARAAHQLPDLTWSTELQTSAHRHNLTMARTNTLSHQVDGEPSLGERETAAGVQWTYAAENIGWTTDRTSGGALDIESRMYGETAPNDAHKRNILSTSATAVGVDVYIDAAHGRLWLTEDFSG